MLICSAEPVLMVEGMFSQTLEHGMMSDEHDFPYSQQ